MTDQPTIHVKGEGGGIFELALPVHEAIAERMERGHVVRCNPDGTVPWTPVEDAPTAPGLPTTQPATGAPKPEWVGWAVTNGALPDDAEAMTKQDLIDKYGSN